MTRQSLIFTRFVLAVAASLALVAGRASADLINFESGYSELDPVTSVVTATNTVTFSLSIAETPFIAEVGAPRVAFAPDDTPAGGNPGSFFLTSGSGQASDYFLDFAAPITELSLEVFDVAGDNNSTAGDTITLTLFADSPRTQQVGSDTYTVPDAPLPDGHAISLAVLSPTSDAVTASIVFSGQMPDTGNGIDNIAFTTVPEPSSAVFLGAAALACFAIRRLYLTFHLPGSLAIWTRCRKSG